MFKRLRERISEEASKSVAQLGNNSLKSSNETDSRISNANSSEDLITLSESSSVVVPHTSSQQFSIGEEDDGSMSEQSTPQKKIDPSNCSTPLNTSIVNPVSADSSFSQEYRPKRLSYIPQSDIESEREEPPTLNLEGISKDQLLSVIDVLKARSCKYKNKYSEVVKNFKELRDEKMKIEKNLVDHQDKSARRVAELREQCSLEQKAKAHLEANLRLMLEEKDNRISVLETQINFLKDTDKSKSENPVDSDRQSLDQFTGDLLTGDTISNQDSTALSEKIERLEHQLNQGKKTITSQTDQILLLRKQNENITQELEAKVKRVNELEDLHVNLKKEHESILGSLQAQLEELKKQQEESVMAMAETKMNMHKELELKEKQLVKAEKEASQYQSTVETEKQKVVELQKQYEDKINELQRQLKSTENTLDEEKQNIQELSRGKTAALTLMQKECAQKITAVEEEWKAKLQDLQSQFCSVQEEGKEKLSTEMEEKLKQSESQIKELNSLLVQLEKENDSLKNSTEKLKKKQSDVQHEESMKCLKDKYGNAEKNYITQMEEMKQRISNLEKEKQTLEEANKNLLKVQEELVENKSKLKSEEESAQKEHLERIQKLQDKMKEQENMIFKLESELESSAKESSEKIEAFKKKIKMLEQEREQLMHEAQERVSATEAKCREDLKALQEKNNKLSSEIQETEQLKVKIITLEQQQQENYKAIESTKVESKEKISRLMEQLSELEQKLASAETERKTAVSELLEKQQKLKEESSLLVNKAEHVENLKSEKDALNEKLKQAESKILSLKNLEAERDSLRLENASILEELHSLKLTQTENEALVHKSNLEETEEKNLKEHLEKENEKLKSEICTLKESFDCEINTLKSKNEALSKQINLLEKIDVTDVNSKSVKKYIESIRQESEKAIKAKEEDMERKLKLLVSDFTQQMDIKDQDCDKITNEILEKNYDLEDRLTREHRVEIAELRQNLFEKECALDDMRDDYEERLQEKDKKLKECEAIIKNASPSGSGVSPDSALLTAESSDWDDTWAVPDEGLDNNTSPVLSNVQCEEHVQEIETLKDELSKCNSEIKELKILLRLSPPESMVNNNNNRRDSLQSIPEPTEFEYLKNIIYEYMMGKEPVTLVKVIAAVLRFSETQTQQVIRKEEARHQTK